MLNAMMLASPLATYSFPYVSLKQTVLLVEDNPLLQYIHGHWLQKLGYEVTIVSSGEEALTQTLDQFMAVLMDIDLPGIDGIYTTEMMKQKNPNASTPIIACTTHEEENIKAACFSVGMADYLQKPISLERLKTCLKEHIA